MPPSEREFMTEGGTGTASPRQQDRFRSGPGHAPFVATTILRACRNVPPSIVAQRCSLAGTVMPATCSQFSVRLRPRPCYDLVWTGQHWHGRFTVYLPHPERRGIRLLSFGVTGVQTARLRRERFTIFPRHLEAEFGLLVLRTIAKIRRVHCVQEKTMRSIYRTM